MKSKIIDFETADWNRLDQFADRTVFQTRDWIKFISETHNAVPLLVELHDGGDLAGYFTGLTFTRFGVKILGSSFPGWTTPYIGFNLMPGVSRTIALAAVEEIAWSLRCMHVEVSDPYLSLEDSASLGFTCQFYASYRTDLRQSEEALFNQMDSACRRCVRKAEKSGVSIEEAHDPAFAEEYYEQLKDVFARQGLVPSYPVGRVRALVRNLEPTGRLLLLRARDPQGNCIATGIFPGYNQIAEFWGNASVRSGQALRPNEMIHWYAMRYWKARGVSVYDWGGEGTYKEKYGCKPYQVPWLIKSRYKFISRLRNEARKLVAHKQRLTARLQGLKSKPSDDPRLKS